MAIDFLKRISKKIGDDCAVLEKGIIITTDAFLENTHFELKYFSFSDIAKKSFSATLSDIAAMAGIPKYLFIAFLYPSYLKEKDFKEMYNTYKNLAKKYKVEIAGGDIVKSKKLGITLTCLGYAKKPILRNTAQIGDKVYITGFVALSETGRLVLKYNLDRKKFKRAIKKHLTPEPRIKLAQILKNKINALIDTSDGLACDSYNLAKASKIMMEIDFDKLPIAEETYLLCEKLNLDLKEFVLKSGEDFELLFTANKKIPKEIDKIKINEIGIVKKGKGVYLIKEDKREKVLPIGYQHIINDS
ncbi:MAG: thiamine-phosphate kinase [candidate division WOR-3 bacterium]|nr:thiamine-phosphate kinase [candidate division WOR-3 bacterium]